MAYSQIRVRRLNNKNIKSAEKHGPKFFHRIGWEELPLRKIIDERIKELGVCGIKKNSTKAIEVMVSISDLKFFNQYFYMDFGKNEKEWLERTYFGEGNVVCGYVSEVRNKYYWFFIGIPVKEKEVAYRNRYGTGKKIEMRLCANDIIDGYTTVIIDDREQRILKLSNMQQKYFEHCRDTYGHVIELWRGLKAEDQKRKYSMTCNTKM